MTSGRDASRDGLDQRLAEARDSILFDGENILAQEMGDQGQAVVLTQSRILIVKAGLAATGEMNGQKTAAYVFDDIESVKLRKGPMGAVIQICTTTPQAPAPGNPPMNVVVFGDPQKVKRSEILAGQIEEAMGKPVDKIEPGAKPEPVPDQPAEALSGQSGDNDQPVAFDIDSAAAVDEPVDDISALGTPVVDLDAELEQIEETEAKPKKGGREARSLADEMFAEMSAWTPPVASTQPDIPVSDEAPIVEPVENPWEDEWTKDSVGTEQVQDSIIESISEAVAEEPEPAPEVVAEESIKQELVSVEDFKPNPNLPTPLKKQKKSGGALVLVGILGLLVIAGLAVMAPLKSVQTTVPAVTVDVDALSHDSKLLQSQVEGVIQYKAEVDTLLESSNAMAATIQASLRSGNMKSAAASARSDSSGKAIVKLEALKAPAGLASAQEDIAAGLFTRKNAAASVAGSMIDAGDALRKFNEASSLIKRGLDTVDAMQQNLEAQITENDTQKNKK